MINSIEGELLGKMIRRRYDSLKKRCEEINIWPPPLFSDIADILTHKMEIEEPFYGDRKCPYCGHELLLKDVYPHKFVPSIDHKLPLSKGGTNAITNLIVCCTRCNIAKGTMEASLWKRILEKLDDIELREQFLDQMFLGRLADKINRIKEEKKTKVPQ